MNASKSLLMLGLSLVSLGVNQLSVLAQTQRYPTNAEIAKLREELSQHINKLKQDNSGSNYLQDSRNTREKQAIQLLLKNWSKLQPETAPFLGSWTGYEDNIHIYPSKIKGKVCIINSWFNQAVFNVGNLSNNQIFVQNSSLVYFRQGDYLAKALIENNKAILGFRPFHNHRIPQTLAEIGQSIASEGGDIKPIIKQFNYTGCILPNNSNITSSINSINTADFYFVADSAFPDVNSAAREVSKLKKSGYSEAGMFWIPDYANLSRKPLFQVYPAKFTTRDACANFISRYNHRSPQAYCVFASRDPNTPADRFKYPTSNSQITTKPLTSTKKQQVVKRSILVTLQSQTIAEINVEPSNPSDLKNLKGNPAISIVIDRVKCQQSPKKSMVCSFDLYNLGYADAVIEVYDARKNLVELRGVDGVRNPTNVVGFPIESIERLYKVATEGFGFNDPRNAAGQSQKTEIRNIVIPKGGNLKITKTGRNANAYNQSRFLMGLFFDTELPGTLPGSIKNVFGENPTLKQSLLSTFFVKLQQERITSIVREGGFADPKKAFITGNWIDQNNLNKLMEIGVKALAEESLKQGVSKTVINQQVLGKKLNIWVTAAELFTKGSNIYLQWLDWDRSQKDERKNESIIFYYYW
jgi:hypothetical protein